MKLICAEDYYDLSRKAANIISAQVILKNNSVLGLATGATVTGIYKQLVEWYEKGDVDFSAVTTINLDEYVGLSTDDANSYRRFMEDNFFSHINVCWQNTHVPDGLAINLDEECARYDKIIEGSGGIDLQLLGLGKNGHIGFNEPNQAFEKLTHCVNLNGSTRAANRKFFEGNRQVPEKAITMGIKSIMQAKKILLCVCGEEKQEILKKVLYGPVLPEVPGSILQMHPDFTVVADAAALGEKTGTVHV